MIILTRVDHRLLHGQVGVSWSQNLNIDSILIANDEVPKDDLRKSTIKLARPQGIKLVIKSINDSIESIKKGATDKYRLFIVVESIEDAYSLAKECAEIKQINLGGTKAGENTKKLSNTVYVNSEDEKMIKELDKYGVEIEMRTLPSDRKQNPLTLIS